MGYLQQTLSFTGTAPHPFHAAPTSAIISACGRYRYELWRRWANGPHVLFVLLNPSTADATHDDATIRRCIGYAKRWGYGSLCVGNLFAFRATNPRDMKAAEDPIGPDNDVTLRKLAAGAGAIIAGWGVHGSYMGRDRAVLAMLPQVQCLRQTKTGAPGHPLYLPCTAVPFTLDTKKESEG